MKMDGLISEVAKAYLNPGEGEADINGNTRLVILQERFGLSSLKLQKILVTAGVYEPVKSGTAFHKVERLRKEGKSPKEIMEITGLSSAAVSACFPYEKSLYHADKNGAAITSAAKRKRKQRDKEEGKRRNALEVLQGQMTDEDFLHAIRDYEGLPFISLKGERSSVEMQSAAGEKSGSSGKHPQELAVHRVAVRGGDRKKLVFPEEEVLAVFHNALDLLAGGRGTGSIFFEERDSLSYVYPLLVVFGILPGNREDFTVRRKAPDISVCACCGRRSVYTVKTYQELVRIAKEIETKERLRWNPEGGPKPGSKEEAADLERWEKAAMKDSPAIRAFNREGEHSLCGFCAHTIFMALEDGELPASRAAEDYSALSLEAASAVFFQSMEEFPEGVRYQDRIGRNYTKELQQGEEYRQYLYREKDKDGVDHTFACHMQELGGSKRIFEAREIHRLTRAGKYARDYTGTDFEYRLGLKDICLEDRDEDRRQIYIGFLELTGRIRDGLTSPSLEWIERNHPIENHIPIGLRQCFLRSTGEMKIVCVDEPSVQGRQWQGGKYGFMIDGTLFTGEEVARMSSAYEGWTLQYRFADPSDRPLRNGEYLMPVQIGDRQLVEEMSQLLNLFTADGRFLSVHDRENFGILFEKTVLPKLKLYHESNPRGYGRLAAMHLIQRLQWIEATSRQEEQIREIVQM